MDLTSLFSLAPQRLSRALRRHWIAFDIWRTTSNLADVSLDIAERQAMRTRLRARLSGLKVEQRSL